MLACIFLMRDFSGIILESYRSEGYRYLQYKPLGFFGLITPLFDLLHVDDGAYTIPIHDEQADALARGLTNIAIYVL